MSLAPLAPPRPAEVRVDVHGLPVTVRCRDRRVRATVAARLSAFPGALVGARPALTLVQVPPPGGGLGRRTAGRTVYSSARCTVGYAEPSDTLWATVGSAGVEVDLAAGVGQFWGTDGDDWALSHPCLALPLVETCRRHGLQPLHAAAVSSGQGVVLLTGVSGAGKSTASLMLAQQGFGFLGDDTVLLRDGLVHGWADEVDVTPATVALLPRLAPLVGQPLQPGWPKHPLPPALAAGSEPLAGPLPPAVLLLLGPRSPRTTPGGATTATRPVPPHVALQALVGDMLLTRPDVVADHLRALERLVHSTPAHAVRVGSDPAEVAEVLARDLDLHP